jgi:hypothetical protein
MTKMTSEFNDFVLFLIFKLFFHTILAIVVEMALTLKFKRGTLFGIINQTHSTLEIP